MLKVGFIFLLWVLVLPAQAGEKVQLAQKYFQEAQELYLTGDNDRMQEKLILALETLPTDAVFSEHVWRFANRYYNAVEQEHYKFPKDVDCFTFSLMRIKHDDNPFKMAFNVGACMPTPTFMQKAVVISPEGKEYLSYDEDTQSVVYPKKEVGTHKSYFLRRVEAPRIRAPLPSGLYRLKIFWENGQVTEVPLIMGIDNKESSMPQLRLPAIADNSFEWTEPKPSFMLHTISHESIMLDLYVNLNERAVWNAYYEWKKDQTPPRTGRETVKALPGVYELYLTRWLSVIGYKDPSPRILTFLYVDETERKMEVK